MCFIDDNATWCQGLCLYKRCYSENNCSRYILILQKLFIWDICYEDLIEHYTDFKVERRFT